MLLYCRTGGTTACPFRAAVVADVQAPVECLLAAHARVVAVLLFAVRPTTPIALVAHDGSPGSISPISTNPFRSRHPAASLWGYRTARESRMSGRLSLPRRR